MTVKLNEQLLEDHLAQIEAAHTWSPRVVSKLEMHLRTADDVDVFRINPLRFAEDKGIDEEECISLFLHATKAGLFDLEWHLVCPLCSQYLASFSSLRHVHSDYYCATCHVRGEAALDDYIEITFSVAEAVRRLKYHDPYSLTPFEYIREYRWAKGAYYPDGKTFLDLMAEMNVFTEYIEPGETKSHTYVVEPVALMGSDVDARTEIHADIQSESTGEMQQLRIVLNGPDATQSTRTLKSGPVTVEITNAGPKRAVVEIHQVTTKHWEHALSLTAPKFLTGSRLIMNHTFRELFTSEMINPTSGLGIKSVSILFTDLKGSTELYERIGDLEAFALIQQHFDRLGDVIRQHDGIVIKTIGDAIMASFRHPIDATKAALAILSEVDLLNDEHHTQQIILKLGIHSGASIAVTLNERLDYFGQTVNIASRVESLANANEICITNDVFNADGVQDLIKDHVVESAEEHFKGVKKGHMVHRIRLREKLVH